MRDDLIRRSDVYKAVDDWLEGRVSNLNIKDIPSADRPSAVDLSSVYSTAYKSGYEKGKADRLQGEWIEQEDCWQCSECGDEYVLEVDVKPIDAKMHYCPNCGARMKGADDED